MRRRHSIRTEDNEVKKRRNRCRRGRRRRRSRKKRRKGEVKENKEGELGGGRVGEWVERGGVTGGGGKKEEDDDVERWRFFPLKLALKKTKLCNLKYSDT